MSCTSQSTSSLDEVIVYYAGSLSLAMIELSAAFENEYPQYRVAHEASGSRTAARKVSDLGQRCDVLMTADPTVIEDLLVPDYAEWVIPFLRNELVLAYHSEARGRDRLEDGGWMDVLGDPLVSHSRCDENSAPCGYRAIHLFQLAEEHYEVDGIAELLTNKDLKFVRPQEPDVFALLETRTVDYGFAYRSSAEQRGVPYLRLPEEINLGNVSRAAYYAAVEATVAGKKPGTMRIEIGKPISYGVTIPTNAPNPGGAAAFVEFLLRADRGLSILSAHHFQTAVPSRTPSFGAIPSSLKKYANPQADSIL